MDELLAEALFGSVEHGLLTNEPVSPLTFANAVEMHTHLNPRSSQEPPSSPPRVRSNGNYSAMGKAPPK